MVYCAPFSVFPLDSYAVTCGEINDAPPVVHDSVDDQNNQLLHPDAFEMMI